MGLPWDPDKYLYEGEMNIISNPTLLLVPDFSFINPRDSIIQLKKLLSGLL